MARVDDQVVHDAFMDNGRLGISQTCYSIWAQRLPCPRNLAIAGHTDPQNPQSPEGRSQSFLTTSTVKEHLVDDDAGPAGSDRGNPDVPGRFEASLVCSRVPSSIPSSGTALIKSSMPRSSQGAVNIA